MNALVGRGSAGEKAIKDLQAVVVNGVLIEMTGLGDEASTERVGSMRMMRLVEGGAEVVKTSVKMAVMVPAVEAVSTGEEAGIAVEEASAELTAAQTWERFGAFRTLID